MTVRSDRWFYPGFRHRQDIRDLHERIKKLESWHRIFDEWSRAGNYIEAAEMAKQGLTFTAYIIKALYLPPVIEMLSRERVLLDGCES